MSYEISKNITVRHTEDDFVSMTNSDKVPNWYDNWDKLQFLLEEDEDPHTEQLYDLLNEILYRIENLEKKSHMHKFQLPENKERWEELGKK
jgi:hypothetical protein